MAAANSASDSVKKYGDRFGVSRSDGSIRGGCGFAARRVAGRIAMSPNL
jgi:hypothetical protein